MKKKWSLVPIIEVAEDSGILKIAELNKHFDFKIERIFYLTKIKSSVSRGEHAHEELKQFILCLSGSYVIELDDGCNKETIYMTADSPALLLDGLVWRAMRDFSSDALMLVLCDRIYSKDKVIRDYNKFINEVANNEI